MSQPDLHVVVPGSIDQRTGGYIYDACMVAGLRRRQWQVVVHELDGMFPSADDEVRANFAGLLGSLPDNARVVIDGLAMGSLPEPVRTHSKRLRILSLVHHPLADETGLDVHQRERLAALERDALSACAGVLVTSESTASRLAAYGVPLASVRSVPPGTEPARCALGPWSNDPPQLLCVASLIPRKGQDVLVRALTRLRGKPWSCVCVGSLTRHPAYATAVQTQVQLAGLAERICFLGECGSDVLNDLYHLSSLFVLPSYYEGYGMALTEALARGLPVVSTTGGAIPETIPDDVGVLVPPGDDRALADALDGLVAGSERRRMLASAARRHAATLPDWDEAAATFAEAIVMLAPDQTSSDKG